MSSLNKNLSELDKLENELSEAMQAAAKCLNEFSKDKINGKTVENQAHEFLKRIKNVEQGMLSQINYLNQVGIGAPHEGAAYMASRERQAAVERINDLQDTLIFAQNRLHDKERQQQSYGTTAAAAGAVTSATSGSSSVEPNVEMEQEESSQDANDIFSAD